MEKISGICKMKISFKFLFLLTILQNEVCGRSFAKKCNVLSPEDVNHYQCGEQFIRKAFAHNSDNNTSIVEIGEFPW